MTGAAAIRAAEIEGEAAAKAEPSRADRKATATEGPKTPAAAEARKPGRTPPFGTEGLSVTLDARPVATPDGKSDARPEGRGPEGRKAAGEPKPRGGRAARRSIPTPCQWKSVSLCTRRNTESGRNRPSQARATLRAAPRAGTGRGAAPFRTGAAGLRRAGSPQAEIRQKGVRRAGIPQSRPPAQRWIRSMGRKGPKAEPTGPAGFSASSRTFSGPIKNKPDARWNRYENPDPYR